MAEVHDLRPVGGAYELVPETDFREKAGPFL